MAIDKNILNRFVADRYSCNDKLSVERYFNDESLSDALREAVKAEWEQTDSICTNRERLSAILKKLHSEIDRATLPHDGQHPNGEEESTVIHRLYSIFAKIAAVLIIPALITIAVLLRISSLERQEAVSWMEIKSPKGSRTEFMLPDSTKGWLNEQSSIRYCSNYMNRRIVEVKGEAWFDVRKVDGRDFTASTQWFDINVLGTKFNVRAYDNDDNAEIILEEGKVSVNDKDGQLIDLMNVDERISYNKKTAVVQKSTVDSKIYTRWKEGILIFRNTPMQEIAERLEHQYGVKFEIHGEKLKTSVFRATFEDESIETIMNMLASVAPIRYRIHERKNLPDGTFSPKRIEMWLK